MKCVCEREKERNVDNAELELILENIPKERVA